MSAVLQRIEAATELIDTGYVTPCRIWTRSKTKEGYGRIKLEGAVRYVHRVVWQITRGPIPEGHVIDHLCRQESCCRDDHLEPVTVQENTRRGLSGSLRKTCPKGHPLDGVRAPGWRYCKTCNRERHR